MDTREYDTMHSIIADLDVNDFEQLGEYADDCRMLGAKRTEAYILNQVKHGVKVRIPIIRIKLVEDFSGCY